MSRLKILKIYVVFWLFIFFLLYANYEKVYSFFLATLTFNVAVLTVLAIGVIIIVNAALRLTMLTGSFAVIRYKKKEGLKQYITTIQKTFPTDIANMLVKRASQSEITFSQDDITKTIDWMEERVYNQKVYINFFVGTSLMIGLLGTFVGLLTAIDQMSVIIFSLSGDVNLAEVIKSFSGPISGMAIGFASSLFGVSSSLILSMKGYILNRSEEVFLIEVKDWMNSKKGELIDMSNATNDDMMRSFAQTSVTISQSLNTLTKGSETMVRLFSSNLEEGKRLRNDEMKVIENISNALRELNINQYQSFSAADESLQELSSATINSNKSIKSMLKLQEKNNELLSSLVSQLNERSK